MAFVTYTSRVSVQIQVTLIPKSLFFLIDHNDFCGEVDVLQQWKRNRGKIYKYKHKNKETGTYISETPEDINEMTAQKKVSQSWSWIIKSLHDAYYSWFKKTVKYALFSEISTFQFFKKKKTI